MFGCDGIWFSSLSIWAIFAVQFFAYHASATSWASGTQKYDSGFLIVCAFSTICILIKSSTCRLLFAMWTLRTITIEIRCHFYVIRWTLCTVFYAAVNSGPAFARHTTILINNWSQTIFTLFTVSCIAIGFRWWWRWWCIADNNLIKR